MKKTENTTPPGQRISQVAASPKGTGRQSMLNSRKDDYEAAREQLLAKVVPDEEETSPTCMWKLCCLFYYMFCCCFCEQNKQFTKEVIRQRFNRWLNLEGSNKSKESKMSVVKNLLRLYAHQSDALTDLQLCRVNPDFTSVFRDDLEFFIPQLGSFYLKGDYEHPEEIANLIVLAASTSFFFSHRVWFFFQSTMFQETDEEIYEKSRQILKALRSVCLENKKEKLYLANSKDLVQLIIELQLTEFWANLKFDRQVLRSLGVNPTGNSTGSATAQSKLQNFIHNPDLQQRLLLQDDIEKGQQIDKMNQVQQIIKKYVDSELQTEAPLPEANAFKLISAVSIDNEGNEITLCAKDIILSPFSYSFDTYGDDHNLHIGHQEMNEDRRLRLHSFLSTPKFIKCLTDVSLTLSHLKATKEEKLKILKEELHKVNQHLPASVYIPFVSNSIRNYAVLHIALSECRVFQTKERAPYMIAVELYRPDELSLYSTNKYPIPQNEGGFFGTQSHKASENQENQVDDSEDSFKFDEQEAAAFQLKTPQNAMPEDEENPYIKDIKERERAKSQKKSRKSVKNQNQTLRKNSTDIHGEGDNISKIADQKVSNAIIINNKVRAKNKDQFIKRIMDDNDIVQTRGANVSNLRSRIAQPRTSTNRVSNQMIREESHEDMTFDIEYQNTGSRNQIEMVTQQTREDPLNSIQLPLDEVVVQGQGSQIQLEEQKDPQSYPNRRAAINPRIQSTHEDLFEDFYSNYRTQSADHNNLQAISEQVMKKRKEEKKAKQEAEQSALLQTQSQPQQVSPMQFKEEDESLFGELAQRQVRKNNTQLLVDPSKKPDYRINSEVALPQAIDLPDSDMDSSDEEDGSSSSADDDIQEENKFIGGDSYRASQAKKEHLRKLKQQCKMFVASEGLDQEEGSLQNSEIGDPFDKPIRKKNILIKETCQEQEQRVRKNSPFGYLKSWRLFRFMVKSNDDVRQEQFAMQLISEIQQIFKLKKLPLWVKTYEILATGPHCGLIDYINDAMSLDEIHKKTENQSLYDFYVESFGKGKKKSKSFKRAQKAFLYSLAGYSLVCYVLAVKDRHNQNIMIDSEGHIIHIDYGFLLSNAPGKGLKFERAPFKLTEEFVNVLRGTKTKKFHLFRNLMKMGFMALQEHADKIIVLVEMMMMGAKDLPCFKEGEPTIKALKERFFPTGKRMNETEAGQFIDLLITESYGNWRTIVYDKMQYCCQGIV